MKIYNVVELYDNGEFVSVVTASGSVINLPEGKHYLALEQENSTRITNVIVDFYEVNS